MAASNINVVVLTGNLTRDPASLRSAAERHPRVYDTASRRQHAPQERFRDRRVGGQAELLRRQGVPGAQGENAANASSPRVARSRCKAGSSGASGRPRTGKSARQSISSRTPSSFSAAVTTPRTGALRRRRPADRRSATCRSTIATSSPPRERRRHWRRRRHSVLDQAKRSDGKAASQRGKSPAAGA